MILNIIQDSMKKAKNSEHLGGTFESQESKRRCNDRLALYQSYDINRTKINKAGGMRNYAQIIR